MCGEFFSPSQTCFLKLNPLLLVRDPLFRIPGKLQTPGGNFHKKMPDYFPDCTRILNIIRNRQSSIKND
jgi:hypothetical protein